MMSLSDDKQADIILALNTTSRYLNDILNINYIYFEPLVSQIYLSVLQLNEELIPLISKLHFRLAFFNF